MGIKKKKYSILIVVVAILVVLSLLFFYRQHQVKKTHATPVKVSVSKIKKQALADILKSYGTVITPDSQDIASQTDGAIIKILYKPGQWVDKGGVLFELDTATLRAELLRAKAGLEFAKQRYIMNKSVFEKRAIAKIDFEKIRNSYMQAREDYKKAQKNAAFMAIKAPISGFVMTSPFAVGSVIQKGSVLAKIVPKEGYQVSYYVDQKWRYLIKVGQAVTITVADMPSVNGKVIYVAPMGTDVHSFEIRASYNNLQQKIILGTTVLVTQDLNKKPQLVLPLQSVGSDTQGFYIYTVERGKIKKIYFSAKILGENKVIAISGLQENTRYVSSDISNLTEGETVEVDDVAH